LHISNREVGIAVHIGTSGWSYDHWENVLYPPGAPAGERLGHYVHRFDTVELNSSFYRWPGPARFAGWRARLPTGFVMSVKAPRGLTHGKEVARPGAVGGQDRRRLARAAGQACGDCRCGVRVGVWATSSRASTPAPNPPARSTCVGGRSSGWRASRGADRGVRSGGSTPLSTMGTTARWTPRMTPITSVARRRSRWTVSFARLCLAGRPDVGDAGCSEERDPDMASPAFGQQMANWSVWIAG